MSIKKLLCKYFSEDDDHKKVTVGSFIVRFLLYIAIFALIAASYTTYVELYNKSPEPSMVGGFGILGVLIEFYILVCAFQRTIKYLSSIEITHCERKD